MSRPINCPSSRMDGTLWLRPYRGRPSPPACDVLKKCLASFCKNAWSNNITNFTTRSGWGSYCNSDSLTLLALGSSMYRCGAAGGRSGTEVSLSRHNLLTSQHWPQARRSITARHQNTGTAGCSMRSRSKRWMLSRVMIPARRPRMALARSFMSMRLNRSRRPFWVSKKRSASESSRASLRATAPNRNRRSTPSCLSSGSCCLRQAMASSRFMGKEVHGQGPNFHGAGDGVPAMVRLYPRLLDAAAPIFWIFRRAKSGPFAPLLSIAAQHMIGTAMSRAPWRGLSLAKDQIPGEQD